MDDDVLGLLALLHASPNAWQVRTEARLQCLALHLSEQATVDLYAFDKDTMESDDVRAALQTAADNDLVTITEAPTYGGDTRYTYTLTEAGNETVLGTTDDIIETAEEVMDEYGDYPVSNLLNETAETYPRFKPLFL